MGFYEHDDDEPTAANLSVLHVPVGYCMGSNFLYFRYSIVILPHRYAVASLQVLVNRLAVAVMVQVVAVVEIYLLL